MEKRVKFQLVTKWYEDSQYMAVKNGYVKKAKLMDWLLQWFIENHHRYTLKRMPGAYQNAKKEEKVMALDTNKIADIAKVSRKMGFVKPTDVLNFVFWNIKEIIDLQEQIEYSESKQ